MHATEGGLSCCVEATPHAATNGIEFDTPNGHAKLTKTRLKKSRVIPHNAELIFSAFHGPGHEVLVGPHRGAVRVEAPAAELTLRSL